MQLTIFNGSPRGKKSNTKILMDKFLEGFNSENNNKVKINYLIKTDRIEEHLEDFEYSEKVIIAFPLYADSMPGIVKKFIEGLEPIMGKKKIPELGFVIQSGFPEPIHSRFVQRYMEKLAKKLKSKHLGSVIRGGIEGIQVQPKWLTKKLYTHFYKLGTKFAETGKFDTEIINKLAPRDRMSFGRKLFFRFFKALGLLDMYWNMELKKNNAYDKRFAKPFKEE